MSWGEDTEEYDGNKMFSLIYTGPDEDDEINNASQIVMLDDNESIDDGVPRLLLKLRKILSFAGATDELLEELLSKERLRKLMPHHVVDEVFIDDNSLDKLAIEEKGKSSSVGIQEYLKVLQTNSFNRVTVERRGIDNFEFQYKKGDFVLKLPKNFFDDIIESEVELQQETAVDE